MKRLGVVSCVGVLVTAAVVAGYSQEVNPGPPDIPAGLVRAFAAIGQNIVGASNFFAINPGPPEAPSLEIWLNDTSDVPVHLNIFDVSPGPPNTWLRLTILNGLVVVQQDSAVGNPDIAPEYGADLGRFVPPSPIVVQPPGPPDFSAGLARAMGEIGQNLLGGAKFFSTKTSPGPPNVPSLDLWLDDTPTVPVNLNIYASGSPPSTWLRVTIANGVVLVQQDTSVGRPAVRVDYGADLSVYTPPTGIKSTSTGPKSAAAWLKSFLRRCSRPRWSDASARPESSSRSASTAVLTPSSRVFARPLRPAPSARH